MTSHREAASRGCEAFHNGKAITENPYDPWMLIGQSWRQAWRREQERKDKRLSQLFDRRSQCV
jgi:hypothetical protein